MNMKELYIVKTKTGMMHYFDGLADAYIFAASQSKKRKTTYTIYTHGRAESAYANGHRLPEFSTLAEDAIGKTKIKLEKSKDDTKLRLRKISSMYRYWGNTNVKYCRLLGYQDNWLDYYYKTSPSKIGEHYMFMLSAMIHGTKSCDKIIFEYIENGQERKAVAPINEDIEIMKEYLKDNIYNVDEIFGRTNFYKEIHNARLIFRAHNFHTESYTIHADKRTYKNESGKVHRVYMLPECISKDMLHIIFKWLCQYDENLQLLALDDVLLESQYVLNPNKYLEFDIYHNNVEFKRRMSSLMEDMESIYPLQVMEHKDVQDSIIRKFRLPDTKSFRKLYNKDEEYYLAAAVARKFGFKNIDLIRTLTDEIHKAWNYNSGLYCQVIRNKIDLKYFKDLISLKGEKIAEKMVSEDLNTAIDVCRMYDEADQLLRAFVVANAHSIMDAHETLVYYNQRTRANTIFEYTKAQKSYEDKIQDFIFYLPEDAFTLATIGAELKICVGSYASAIKNRCTTVLAMKSHDKNIACLEINNGELVQIKQVCNNPLRQEYKDIVTQYFTKHKVEYRKCPDYQRIGSAWNCRYDYHVIDPNTIRRNTGDDYKLKIIKYTPYQPANYFVF